MLFPDPIAQSKPNAKNSTLRFLPLRSHLRILPAQAQRIVYPTLHHNLERIPLRYDTLHRRLRARVGERGKELLVGHPFFPFFSSLTSRPSTIVSTLLSAVWTTCFRLSISRSCCSSLRITNSR